MSIGFKKKTSVQRKEAGYDTLTDLQKFFYDEAELEFEECKLKISNATKKADLAKVTERTINVTRLARKISKKLGRNVNKANANKVNCPFLYNRIQIWNQQLEALYLSTDLTSDTWKSKEEVKSDHKQLKAELKKINREINIKELELAAELLLVPTQAEMKNKIARLEMENEALNKKNINLEMTRAELIKQLTSGVESSALRRKLICYENLLRKNGIEY